MEKINLNIKSAPSKAGKNTALCGVVGSGNLEVLFRKDARSNECHVEINTSTNGYRAIWRSVLEDFANNNAVGGFSISINDMGATPAVVALRLSQGLAMCTGTT